MDAPRRKDRPSVPGIPDTRPEFRLAYSPTEAAQKLGISRSSIYALMRAGTLRTARAGARRLIPAAELDRLLGGVTLDHLEVPRHQVTIPQDKQRPGGNRGAEHTSGGAAPHASTG